MPHEFKRRQLPDNAHGVLAAIIERDDGGPMRPIATGRRRRPVGCYYSFKCGYASPWESRNELHGLYHAEVRFDVVKYRAQPHTLEMIYEGRKCKLTPDLELVLSNGRVEIIEIKGDFDALADPDYSAKLEMARQVYGSIGQTFRVVDRKQLEAQPRFKAIEEIQNYRRTAITTGDMFLVSNLFKSGEPLTLADLKGAYGNAIVGMAKAYAMMVRRVIEIDITRGLNDNSPVRLPSCREAVDA